MNRSYLVASVRKTNPDGSLECLHMSIVDANTPGDAAQKYRPNVFGGECSKVVVWLLDSPHMFSWQLLAELDA
jgi:hypothetical protein